jgi:hypothetical protein
MNQALILFDGLLIIPMLQICWTVGAIVQGGMYFKEFESFSDEQFAGFSIGVFLMLAGAYFLAPGAQQQSHQPQQSYSTVIPVPGLNLSSNVSSSSSSSSSSFVQSASSAFSVQSIAKAVKGSIPTIDTGIAMTKVHNSPPRRGGSGGSLRSSHDADDIKGATGGASSLGIRVLSQQRAHFNDVYGLHNAAADDDDQGEQEPCMSPATTTEATSA